MTDPEKTETTPVVEEKAISPKDLVKVERPNKAKLLEECKVLEDQRNIVEAKIVAVKREIESFAAQEQEMDKIQREKEQARNEVNALRKQREAIEGAMNKFNADRKQTRSQIRFTNVADIDREIKKLEDKQSTTSMSLNEEKQILKEIGALRESKKTVQQFDTMETTIKTHKTDKRAIETQMDAKKKQLDAIYDRSKAQYEKMKVLESKKRELRVLLDEKKKLWGEIDALWTVFKAADKEWKDYKTKLETARRQQREKENEARKAEEEKRRAEFEALEALKIPYEEEMALCDYLANFLERTYLSTEAPKVEDKVVDSNELVLEGLQSFKRDEDDFMVMGGGKKKNKKGGKGGKKKEAFKLPIETMNEFNTLQIQPPLNKEMVAETITALKDKKVWYSEQPRPEKKTKESENSTDEKKKINKKANKSYNADEVDFPTLAGFVPQSTVANGITQGVSDIDAIKGQSS